jgi:hypothetical protein
VALVGVTIDGAALAAVEERLRNAESFTSTGAVDDETREFFHANIARGMEWLDEHMPGWSSRIDVETLDLGEPCRCVLGSLDGNYYEAMLRAGHAEVDDLGIIRPDWKWAVDHGFATTSTLDFESWDVLTGLWKQRLAMREALDTVIGDTVVEGQHLVDA